MSHIRLALAFITIFSSQNIFAQSIITTVAGGGSGENMPALNTAVIANHVAVDRQGNLYCMEQYRLRKINKGTNTITTIAGDGQLGYYGYGDGGPASAARFSSQGKVVIDYTGNIYVADGGRIRKIDTATGIITTIAGGGPCCNYNDNIPATSATIDMIDFAVDRALNIYTADFYFSKIRKITAATGLISTVAGTGIFGYNGDNIAATSADLNSPCAVTVDVNGDIIIGDNGNSRIRKVIQSTGKIITIAGNGTVGFSGDGGPATNAQLNLWTGTNATYVYNLSTDSAGNIYVVDNKRVRKIDAADNTINTIAGDGTTVFSGDGLDATLAGMNVRSVAADGNGNLYIPADRRIRKVDQQTHIINSIAGNGTLGYGGDGGQALDATLYNPSGIATDTSGNLYINDQTAHQLRKVDISSGIITTFAGTGIAGYNGDNINAKDAQLASPTSIAIDKANNLYIADAGNNRIRKINLATNIITTIGGTGTAGSDGDNGLAITAKIGNPGYVNLDDSGNVCIYDRGGYPGKIRKIITNGYIYTLLQSYQPFLGNDPSGNLYLMPDDTSRIQLLKWDKFSGNTTVVAGGYAGYGGDNGTPDKALFSNIAALAFDRIGNIFIADKYNHRVRMINTADNIVTTVAGNGIAGFSGDDSAATAAKLNGPAGIYFNNAGDMLIADAGNGRIRKVTGIVLKTAVCGGQNRSLQSNLWGSNYQWQVNTGNGFTNIADNGNYTGTNDQVLKLNDLNQSWYGYEFRCLTDGHTSYVYTLKFTNTWTGGTGTAWEDAGNWSCGVVPDSNTDVIINNGTVLISSSTTIRTLTVGKSANIEIAAGNNINVIY